MMMGFGDFGYGGHGFGILGWVFEVLIFIGIVSFVIYLVRSLFHRHDSTIRESNPKEIAAHRYARGEISEEEYKKIIDHL